ncbi:site-specific integrase [Streptomyces caniscabiei]|nr:site-specific integrase [Streptomyces caniscabiei]MDX3515934.1 site-specific integrase [Streptomyces caniscabiei]MDX3725114.1 site-specific integrase [Streptomyces caniscabiei]WEO21675.1 site-specific integrase [Streptomyces caniscabiei]
MVANSVGWQVYRYDLERPSQVLPGDLSAYAPDLRSWVERLGGRHGQRFLLGPDGLPDPRVNAFFASPTMRNLSDLTNRGYAYSLALWLNFLLVQGRAWWEATEEDAEEFQFWRLTDPGNDGRVQTSSFARDVAGCRKFYRWAGKRCGVSDPFDEMKYGCSRRQENVKWLDPAAIRRWRDLGVRGRGLDGRVDRRWRGRNDQRDGAFVDGLYGTGLRLSSWASVVLPELPRTAPGRGYFACSLADQCAKGGYGYTYWMPRAVAAGVRAYREGARARAVRRAQESGLYETVRGLRVVRLSRQGKKVGIPNEKGGTAEHAWNDLSPQVRRCLFVERSQGLEPLWLWLNEDGMPRDAHGWHHTFEAANARIADLGLEHFTCTAHMHRHSFALKWFSVGKLVFAQRLGHLTEEEMRDFREQFGDHWHLVQTMLGHRRVETTKEVYLEPFRNLQVELLLAQADGFPVERFMADAFAGHPRVHTDPLAVAR